MNKLKYRPPLNFDKKDNFIDNLIIYTDTKELIKMVASFYSIDNKEAVKIIDDYKERYKFDLCPHCGEYAVTLFYSNSSMGFTPDDTNDKWGSEIYYDDEPLDNFGESMQEIALTAEICLNCDELINVEAQKN